MARVMQGIRWAFNCSTWNPSKQEWLLACSCIQREEKERISRFVHFKDAKLSMGGRLLTRTAVAQLLLLPNKAIKLSRDDKGKPFLLDPVDDVQFNVSHDGNYVVLAAERSKVGVDLMQITRPVGSATTGQFFHQMKRQFTENEWKQILCHQNERQQLTTFFRLWCLKESYIKAIGAGIGMGLQRMEFILSSMSDSQGAVKTGSKLKLDGLLLNEWTFEESFIDAEHYVCVATPKCCGQLCQFSEIDFDEILDSLEPLHQIDNKNWEIFVNNV